MGRLGSMLRGEARCTTRWLGAWGGGKARDGAEKSSTETAPSTAPDSRCSESSGMPPPVLFTNCSVRAGGMVVCNAAHGREWRRRQQQLASQGWVRVGMSRRGQGILNST